ncbi:MAG: 1-acyl-sn-glycerol-3-phosphate acyltransferase [Pseudomonadota bacterium]
MIRGLLFTGVYYLLSVVYVLASLPFLALPGRGPVTSIIRSYTRAINIALHWIGGIKKDVRGREKLPEGAFILAPKHASWGDGFMVYPDVKNLAFVTGDHLERFPLVGGILRKLGAIVIDTCGGGERKAASLAEGMSRAREDGRRILIYPEGHLAPVGYHFRYKPGVWHMQKAMNAPIVPVATNLNCFWQQEEIAKKPGTAVIEFLDPIPPGLSKEETMARLTDAIETRSAELIAEATGGPVRPSQLLPDPVKGTIAQPEAGASQSAKA